MAPTIPRMVVRMNPAGSFLPGMRNLAITPAMKPMTIVQIIPMAMVLQKRTPLIHDDTHYVLREERSGQPVHSDQGIWPYLVEGSRASQASTEGAGEGCRGL